MPGFTMVGQLAAKAAGVPDVPVVVYPGAVGIDDSPTIRRKITDDLIEQIISALTRDPLPSTVEKANLWNARAIVKTGSFEEINAHFMAEGWTDGLPIVPPTLARVEAFLRFTERSQDEVIAILPQAKLRATVWNIAANGVMAGCRPEHMPLLVAMVEALQEDSFNLDNIGTTWGLIPYMFVNGPIVGQLGLNSGAGLISNGPNPALGRALGLVIRNIAGFRPAKNQMGTFGYPINFCFAENEAQSPWKPFHVERGFAPQTSTVSVSTTMNWGFQPSPYARDDKPAAQTILEQMCRDLTRKPPLALFAERSRIGFVNDVTFLLPPPLANALAKAGYSKDDVRQYVYENARVTRSFMEWEMKYAMAEVRTMDEKIALGTFPKSFDVGPEDLIQIVPGPEFIEIVVAGDPGRNRLKTLDSGYTRVTTKEVKLPAGYAAMLAG